MKKVFVVAVLVLTLMAIAVPSVYGVLWNAGQESIEGDGEDDYAVPDSNGAEYNINQGYQDCVCVITPEGSRWERGWAVWCTYNGNMECEASCTPLGY